jgi:transposase-like protein
MAQHHRLSPLARDITLATVGRMTDAELVMYYTTLRWGSETMQGCPKCGSFDSHYSRRRRHRSSRRPCSSWQEPTNPAWQCKHCQAVFSVTTGTLFDRTKLPLRTILYAALLFLGPGNGASAVGISGVSGLAASTALLLQHRFREAMAADQPAKPFEGMVQMDGGYFGGKPRKSNRRHPNATKAQLQRRFGKASVTPSDDKPWKAIGLSYRNWRKRSNKRCVLVVTDSNGARGDGSKSVAVAVARGGESEYAVGLMARAHIAPRSIVFTDEAGAYTQLAREHEHHSVSHAKQFSDPEGVNDNHAEAFFSRMRRAEYGIYNGSRTLYLHYYACEAAWRHNHRRLRKSEMVRRLLKVALSLGPSLRLRGYYERRGCRTEVLIDSPSGECMRHSI